MIGSRIKRSLRNIWRAQALARDLALANGCLDMVREDLEAYGVDMQTTPPMMYNDALRFVVSALGIKAGFTDTREIAAYVRAWRAPKSHRIIL